MAATEVPTKRPSRTRREPLGLGRKVGVGALFLVALGLTFLPVLLTDLRLTGPADEAARRRIVSQLDTWWLLVQFVLIPAVAVLGARWIGRVRPVAVAVLGGELALLLFGDGTDLVTLSAPLRLYLGLALVSAVTIGAAHLGGWWGRRAAA